MSDTKKTPFAGIGDVLARNKTWTNFFYGVGAAVVLIGALFKIQHWPFASEMLTIGMATEAVLFAMSAFEKPHKEYHWEEVYPELGDSEAGSEKVISTKNQKTVQSNSPSVGIGGLSGLSEVQVTPQEITRLTDGLKKLGDLTESLNSLEGISDANKHLVDRLNSASVSVKAFEEANTKSASSISEGSLKLSGSYSKVADNFETEFAQVTKDTKEYGEHLSMMSSKISSINAVYELQLKSVTEQLTHMEELGQSVTKMNDAFAGSIPDANAYRLGAERLKAQIENLNSVYGNMLNALSANV